MVHLLMFMKQEFVVEKAKQPLQPVATLQDRKSHAEPFVVSFLAEHTLSFTIK